MRGFWMTFRNRGIVAALGLAVLVAGAQPSHATMPSLRGPTPAEVAAALKGGLLELPARPALAEPAAPGAAGTRAAILTSNLWRVPVILVSYSDSALITTAQEFNQELFDTTGSTPTGSVFDYYQWASGGRLRVIPTVVATVTVSNTRRYYGADSRGINLSSTPRNDAGLVTEALQICFRSVEWTRFDLDRDGYVDMLWVVHAGRGGEGTPDLNDLWSITSRLSGYWFNSQAFDVTAPGGPHLLVDRFSILPELSLFATRRISEIGVYCHEFGHAMGLPDLYDTVDPRQLNTGPGNWSLMSTGVYGGDGHSPQYPTHPGAWCSLYLGWTQSFRPAQDTLVTLTPIPRGGQVLELWFQGEFNREHFLLECRRREGFDGRLPAEGLIIYHVDELEIGQRIGSNQVNSGPQPALVLVEADGRSDLRSGWDHGDASDPFPGALQRTSIGDDPTPPNTATFRGAPTNLALYDIAMEGEGVRFHAQVRAPGWLPADEPGGAGYSPVSAFGSTNRVVIDAQGVISSVESETRAGHDQVILRSSTGGEWQPPFQISQSSGNAHDPSVALLPGGDLAVAWSDDRTGHSRLYYRARIRGIWIDEQPITDLPGESLAPTIGADARGTVQVAWIYLSDSRPQVLFERFAYLSPFGQPLAVTGPTDRPGVPNLAVAPDGSSYIVWSDQATNPQSLRFARFDPRLGFGPVQTLTGQPGSIQESGHVIMDAAGTLHSVWLVSGAGLNEIHYQRRPASGNPAPADTTLEVDGGLIQGPRLAADPEGGIHLVYQSPSVQASQIRYKRWRPGRGWDQRSTEVTLPAMGNAQRPGVAPVSPGVVSVLYAGYAGGQPQFMERRRVTDLPGALDIAIPPSVAARLVLGPNPLRAGQPLRMSWAGNAPGPNAAVDFFDLSGRLVATARLAPGASASGPASPGVIGFGGSLAPAASDGWSSGVYFGRVRGSRQPATRLVFLR
jgi:immune inhibitor A